MKNSKLKSWLKRIGWIEFLILLVISCNEKKEETTEKRDSYSNNTNPFDEMTANDTDLEVRDTLFLGFYSGMRSSEYSNVLEQLKGNGTIKGDDYQFIFNGKVIPMEIDYLGSHNSITGMSIYSFDVGVNTVMATFKKKYTFKTVSVKEDIKTSVLGTRMHYSHSSSAPYESSDKRRTLKMPISTCSNGVSVYNAPADYRQRCSSDESCSIYREQIRREKIISEILDKNDQGYLESIVAGTRTIDYYLNEERRLVIIVISDRNNLFPADNSKSIEVKYLNTATYSGEVLRINGLKNVNETKKINKSNQNKSIEKRKKNFMDEL